MTNPKVQNWTVRKPVARGRGGVVASQNMHAARAGAEILKRGGTAMEVAQAIVWLLSEDASYTTMSLIDVSGAR